jgi:alpha-L-fucosidase
MPSSNPPFNALAYTVKLTFSGQIPTLGAGSLPTGWAKIVNATSGLVLDGGGNAASGSNLKQWGYDGSTNLQWQLVPLGGGYYRIVNNTNGAPARQAPWNGGNNQQWSLNSAGNGLYHIVNRGTGTALDGAGSTTIGSTTIMWSPNSSPNNEWSIVAV